MKITKKIVSLVMCVIVVFLCGSVSMAESNDFTGTSIQKIDSEYPLIIIPGIKFDKLYVDEGTEDERGYISNITVGSVLGGVTQAASRGLFAFSKDVFMDEIISYLADAFKYVSCDTNGDSMYNVSPHQYPLAVSNYSLDELEMGTYNEEGILATAVEHYGADMVYYYSYDWRADPLDNSDGISNMVERAKADHNCDKVNIVSASLGGINTVAYLYEYGYSDVNSCVFLSSTYCGTYVATDLLNGKVSLSGETLYNFLDCLVGDRTVLKFFIKSLYKSNVFDFATDTVNNIVDEYGQKIYDKMLRDTFATVPSLWSVVLPESYDDCINYMFGTDELKSEYAGIIERADALQHMVGESDELLKEAQDNGVKLSFVAGYDTALIPVYENANTNGDGTLETSLMAGRALVADYGKTLGDGYTADDMSMVSPDNVIDMTNSLFPYNTWLVKDAPHVACLVGSGYSEFVFKLIDSEKQPTTDNFEGYSRFMRVDSSQNFIKFDS